ncbi:MAG TPA: SoxY-related AACIE arm protein [Xanthobacteraceae bacterium]|jgi:sulfur-oxidizing protein SoxY
MSHDCTSTTRRELLLAGAAGVGAILIRIEPAAATPETMQRAIRQVVGEAPVRKGKVTLDVPALVENGNSVGLTIEVASPMTANDYVKAIHVFNEKNPLPNVVTAHLGPRAGRAKMTTRFRLADTQAITAIAEMSDGTFWSASADVIVTLQACLENLD